MKKLLSLAGLSLSLFAFAAGHARGAEQLSCEDLYDVTELLQAAADDLDSAFYISNADDEALEFVSDIALLAAEAEGNRRLIRLADELEEAWISEDADLYIDAADELAYEFDRIYRREC